MDHWVVQTASHLLIKPDWDARREDFSAQLNCLAWGKQPKPSGTKPIRVQRQLLRPKRFFSGLTRRNALRLPMAHAGDTGVPGQTDPC